MRRTRPFLLIAVSTAFAYAAAILSDRSDRWTNTCFVTAIVSALLFCIAIPDLFKLGLEAADVDKSS